MIGFVSALSVGKRRAGAESSSKGAGYPSGDLVDHNQ